jgi:hypothetical protein
MAAVGRLLKNGEETGHKQKQCIKQYENTEKTQNIKQRYKAKQI